MKLLPSLLALGLAASSAGAIEVSHSASYSQGPATTYSAALFLPIFTPGLNGVPDNATLVSAVFNIQSSFVSFNQTYNDRDVPLAFDAMATITADFGLDDFTLSQPFSVSIPARSQSFKPFVLSSSFTPTATPVIKASTSGDQYFIPFQAQYGFTGIPSGAGIFSVNEFLNGSVNATVTYTYGVPDGGSTIALLAAGLISLRFAVFRR